MTPILIWNESIDLLVLMLTIIWIVAHYINAFPILILSNSISVKQTAHGVRHFTTMKTDSRSNLIKKIMEAICRWLYRQQKNIHTPGTANRSQQ